MNSHRRPRSSKIIESLESRVLLSTSDLVRNGGFEGAVSSGDWALTGNFQADSRFTNVHSGTGYAYLSNTDGSAGNSISGTMKQTLTIPASATSATISFWSKITTTETTTTAQNDVETVSIMNAAGTSTLQSLVTLSNLNASSSYVQQSFTLSNSLIGQTVTIAFSAANNATNATTFRVDDVSLLANTPSSVAPLRVVGYLPYYRYSSFHKMDLSQVTHINYFSISAGTDGSLTTTNIVPANLADVVNTMHALGKTVSITVGPISFTTLAADATARATFATNIKNYLVANNLDGVDIDWEPPGTTSTIHANYGLMIDALYAQLHPLGKLITAAVNPYTKEIPAATVNSEMDWLNVMCYDFDYANGSPYSDSVSGMNGWASYGVSKSKLVMGVPFYGAYGTSWSDSHSLTYGTILSNYKSQFGAYPAPNVDSYVDPSGNTIYFNNQSTMQQKMAFLRDNGFGGTMIWELGQDHWDSSSKYDSLSELPIVGTMMNPPAWLSPATNTWFDLAANTFTLANGSATLLSDASQINPTMSLNLSAGTTTTLNAAQRFSGITIASTAKLNIQKNNVVVDYSSASPLGAWNGTNYTGLLGQLKSGRNGGAWNGNGIMTNASTASALGTIGIAEASDVLGITGTQTKSWNGRTVDATTILMRYTYGGDVNLDGVVNGDDYFRIDAGFASHATGYAKGDLNLDGKINSDDYFIIDSHYNKNAVALSTVATPPIFHDGAAVADAATQTSTKRMIDDIEPDASELL